MDTMPMNFASPTFHTATHGAAKDAPKLGDARTDTAAINNTKNGENSTDDELRQAFQSFVGETFYGQLLQAMRKTVGNSAYFHGGRAEEVFRGQLDQVIASKLASSEGNSFAEGLFELQFASFDRR